MIELVPRPSPNFATRVEAQPVDILLMHYTGMRTAIEAMERLCDAEARVSSHYTIDEDGTMLLELRVATPDLGKVIGKQGRTARSIRTLLAAAGMKQDKKIVFEIVE